MSGHPWSDELTELSRMTLSHPPILPRNALYLKNIDGRFAKIAEADLIAQQFRLLNLSNSTIIDYKTCEDVLFAGWVID